MGSCNESSQSDAVGVVSCPLTRAGLRRPPRGAEPTGAFVVIEMAVLFCVSAMAMVSIIVSIDDGMTGQPGQQVERIADRARPSLAGQATSTPAAREAIDRKPATAPVSQ